jgi:hypothetical protein
MPPALLHVTEGLPSGISALAVGCFAGGWVKMRFEVENGALESVYGVPARTGGSVPVGEHGG